MELVFVRPVHSEKEKLSRYLVFQSPEEDTKCRFARTRAMFSPQFDVVSAQLADPRAV